MKILIKKISTGTEDKLFNIYESCIHGEMKSGYEIKAEIIRNYYLYPYIGKTVNCLILAYKLIDIQVENQLKIDLYMQRIYGKYLGLYEISKEWDYKHSIFKYHAINTLDGIILLYEHEIMEEPFFHENYVLNERLKKDIIISFQVVAFKLLAFKPINL